MKTMTEESLQRKLARLESALTRKGTPEKGV